MPPGAHAPLSYAPEALRPAGEVTQAQAKISQGQSKIIG